MKPKLFKYFTVKAQSVSNVFDFTSMDDLKRYAECNAIKEVFVLLNEEGEPGYFSLLQHNNLFRFATHSYITIEDYYAAQEGGFPNAAAYYEATTAGYTCYKDHLLVTSVGITDKAVFDNLVATGFTDGYANWNSQQPAYGQPAVTNALELYNTALAKGFTTFHVFEDATQHGFESFDEYTFARADGFVSKADLEEARTKKYHNYAHLEMGRKVLARDAADLAVFVNLASFDCNSCTMDQRVFVTFLSQVQEGSNVQVDKLIKAYLQELDNYKYADTNEFPKWFSIALCDKNAIIEFLQSNEQVNRYGTYNEQASCFFINHIKERKVVIDGSNVAYNSHGDAGAIPSYNNIMRMVHYLKEKGFTDISVISDASLRHKVSDKEKFADLKAMVKYEETVVATSADPFLINYVKQHRCLLVTNDLFKEWKLADPWIEKHIDAYALRFRIYPNHVSIRDLEEQEVAA
jgi:hypothetical protein